jgi:hypothetical protein
MSEVSGNKLRRYFEHQHSNVFDIDLKNSTCSPILFYVQGIIMSIAFSGLLFSSFVPLRQVSLHFSQLQDIWHYRSMSEPFLGKRKAQKLTLKCILIPTHVQYAFFLISALLIDTFVVRTLITPICIYLCGDKYAWWPRRDTVVRPTKTFPPEPKLDCIDAPQNRIAVVAGEL